ncbi:MAG: cyclic pyranopterin monophosphate synthase MoaC [Paracoccaceae bacterium]
MSDEKRLSHLNDEGKANMVDVSSKEITTRTAKASCKIFLNKMAFNLVKENSAKKGDVLAVARIAGIIASKKTSDLIPLCHQLNLSKVEVNFGLSSTDHSITVRSITNTADKTGVEMEALVAASVAGLTIYDMLKAVDKGIRITDILLDFKHGGKSGTFRREKL